jgi:hypothetical protein
MFWRMDLEYFGRGLLGAWPQADIGIVLWSLSVSAADWQTSDKLTRLCTIPEPATLTGTWDRSAFALEAKILRPLLWFGLLEHRSEKIPNIATLNYYRKTALFERLLKFDVKVEFWRGFATDEPIIFCCGQWYRTPPRDAALRRSRRWFDLSDPGKYAAVARFHPRPAS